MSLNPKHKLYSIVDLFLPIEFKAHRSLGIRVEQKEWAQLSIGSG